MVVQKHISICKQPINIWINEHYIRSSHYITASISFISINSVTTWQTQPQSGARNVIPLIGHITFLLLQKHLTSGTELILTGWKIVPNEEHVQCDHRFASQPLANEPLHSSQLFGTSLQKARGTTSLCGPWATLHFLASKGGQKV